MPKKSGQSSVSDPSWVHELRGIQSRIEGLQNAFNASDLSHGMILFMSPGPDGHADDPRFYAIGDSLIEAYSCDLDFGGRLTHFLYVNHGEPDHARHLLVGLSKALNRIGGILSSIPKKTLPSFPHPTFGDGKQDRMARWCSTLHYLGTLSDNRSFSTELEFSEDPPDTRGVTEFKPWEACSAVDDFDPMDFLLTECFQAESISKWTIRFEEEGRAFPKAISSSLTKPVAYASLNAIDKIISGFKEQPKKQIIRTAATDTDEHPTCAEYVLDELRTHHGCKSEVPNFSPIKQKEFAEEINLSQPEVSKMISYWMEKIDCLPGMEGHAKYKALCRREEIRFHLDLLSTPKPMRERLLGDLKQGHSGST